MCRGAFELTVAEGRRRSFADSLAALSSDQPHPDGSLMGLGFSRVNARELPTHTAPAKNGLTPLCDFV
jgi:hypothetical protein